MRDAGWIAAGVVLSAAGTLAGVSLLTSQLDPRQFGLLSMLLATSVLATQIAAGPVAQAAIHLFPRFNTPARLRLLRGRIGHAQRCGSLLVGIVLAVGGGALAAVHRIDWLDIALILSLFATESSRALRISMLNAARRHVPYALWVALDAWARPIAAVIASLVFAPTAQVALAAHVVMAVVLNLLFGRDSWRHSAEPSQVRSTITSVCGGWVPLKQQILRYAAPLVPMALLTWTVNVGDRFAIGAILDQASVGLYAAAYGLASAPFMMLAGMIEQAVRPHYQQAVSARNYAHADRLLRVWLGTVCISVLFGWALFLFAHKILASWILGPTFAAAATLMPWIAAGYALRATATVLERVCYGHARTRSVLMIQTATALTAIAAVPLATGTWGLEGSAAAVAAVFAVQLSVAAAFAYHSRTGLDGTGPGTMAA